MFLLIHNPSDLTYCYEQIYIPLCFYLYQTRCERQVPAGYSFTFHYVSTYTTSAQSLDCSLLRIYIPLCFYLYSCIALLFTLANSIYIPLCFYLYGDTLTNVMNGIDIYIPLCFYLYLSLLQI